MRMTTMMMKRRRRTRRKKSLRPMKTHRPPVHQTLIHRWEGAPAAQSARSSAAPIQNPVLARSPPRGESGPVDGRPPRAGGGRCSRGKVGRALQGPSPPAARAAPPAAASPPAWSCPRRSATFPRGPSYPRLADTSRPPLRGGRLPSEHILLFVPFHPAATGRLKFQPLHHHWGRCTEPPDTCPGRAQARREVLLSQ